jgi:predicted dehydrogenase
MNTQPSRRQFLQTTALGSLALAGFPALAADSSSASGKVRLGVMGCGRGMAHIASYTNLSDAHVAYICDVDAKRAEAGAAAVEKKTKQRPKVVTDFRRILDDKDIDVISIAAPNFWHTPATVLACAAGKHVYVEKPASHNAREAELIVAAARKWKRHVQMGNQRRSMPHYIEGMQKLKDGMIGTLRYARAWYQNARGTIRRGQVAPVPAGLDYELWQGPVPERPFKDNLLHYNWHWMWHWGGGELANNGPHFLDVARWGLGVDLPNRITCNGGRYHFDDDQETPDTASLVLDYGHVGISFEWSSCHPRKPETYPICTFYGDGGTMAFDNAEWKAYDLRGKEIGAGKGSTSADPHFSNFIDVVRGEAKTLNSEIADAQKSTMLCHLGNIAYRSGQTLNFDPKKKQLINPGDAMKFWSREYRKGWEPKV